MRFRSLFEGVDEPAYVVRDEETVTLTDAQVDLLSEAAGIGVGCLAPVVEAAVANAMEMPHKVGDVRNPAPGLWESLTGTPLPTWTEMRDRFPALPPLKVNTEKLRGQHPTMFEVDEFAAFAPTHGEAMIRAVAQSQVIEAVKASRVSGAEATDVGKVDFREMLKDDAAAWSVKARLEKVLGRAYLATALADQLAPDIAVMLADRLDKLVEQAVADHELATAQQVAAAVTAKVQEYRQSRATRTEAATHERFGRPSRLD